jgi:hypothetical protein
MLAGSPVHILLTPSSIGSQLEFLRCLFCLPLFHWWRRFELQAAPSPTSGPKTFSYAEWAGLRGGIERHDKGLELQFEGGKHLAIALRATNCSFSIHWCLNLFIDTLRCQKRGHLKAWSRNRNLSLIMKAKNLFSDRRSRTDTRNPGYFCIWLWLQRILSYVL